MRRFFTSYKLPILVGLLSVFAVVHGVRCQGVGADAAASAGSSASDDTSGHDSLFTQIHLSDDGVTAVGQSGGTYRFDFDADRFVTSDISVGGRRNDEGGNRRDFEPVEIRCVDPVDIPAFSENVVVDETEFVEGDIFATGRVTIKGWVKGDVRSLNRRVLVTESGQVDGDIEAPEITIKDGGVVLGNQSVVSAEDGSASDVVSVSEEGIGVIVGFTLFFLILGFVLLSIIPLRIERFENCMKRYRWRSALLGIVLTILLPFMIVIAAVTIIGIPVAVALPLVFVYVGAIGCIVSGMRISQYLGRRYVPALSQPLAHLFVGVPLFMLPWVFIALLLGTPDDASQGFGTALLVVSIIGSSFAIASGVGAAFLTRLGGRDYVTLRDKVFGEPLAPAPAPPPKPEFQQQTPPPAPPPRPDTPPIS